MTKIHNEKEPEIPNIIIPKLIEEDYNSVVFKSVGKQKTKKVIDKVLLSLAFVAAIGVGGKAVHTNYVIEEAKETYVEDIKDFEEREMHSTYINSWLNFEDIGNALPHKVIEKVFSEGADISEEIIMALGLTIDEVDEEYLDYNIKNSIVSSSSDNKPWAEKIYNELRNELAKNGVIELPETLIGFLTKTDFAKSDMKFNPLTGDLFISKDSELTEKEMVENLVAYAKYLVYQKSLNQGGPTRG